MLWRHQVPALVAAGFRVIAPDIRGYGLSDIPRHVADYRLPRLVADVVGILDALGVEQADLAGHDWGAVIAWHLCIAHPERIRRFVALSVGHPTAYAKGPPIQKLMGYYILAFQFRGLAERLLSRNDFALFGSLTRFPEEMPTWRADLSRPGRLTAALNIYRANLGLVLPRKKPSIPHDTLGVWSTDDFALCEKQMLDSARYVTGSWRYHRIDGIGHWLPLAAPEAVNSLLIEHFAA